jgi:hypothetical protein
MNLKVLYQSFKDAYNSWAVDHPYWAGLVVVTESAAIGAAADLIMNGVDFSKSGVKHALTIVGVAIINAVRNYLRSSPPDLRARLKP